MQCQWQCQYEFSACDASIRIKRVLDQLNTMQSNQGNKSSVELEKEANELIHSILINNQYSNASLMNDFYHIKYHHDTYNNHNQFDAFHDYLCDHNNILECDITHCPSATRYFNRRQLISCIPFQDQKDKSVELDSFTLHLLSRIHTDLVHSQDIHKHKHNHTNRKYIESSIDCNEDTMLFSEQNNAELKCAEPFMDSTQSIIADEIDSEGVEFWYWEKHKENKRYIATTHQTLKDEILNCNPMTIAIWNALHKECELLMDVNDIKQITSNGHNAKTYDINDGDTITLEHVLSIKLYTDCSSLSDTFRDAFRSKTNIESLIDNNRKIANWARLLIESVQSYGTFRSIKTTYFRAIHAAEFVFKQLITRYNVPLSTTYDLNEAKQLSEDCGMIMVFSIYDAHASGFDTFKLSAYPEEKEVLFFGATLELSSVHQFCHNTWRNYKGSDFISNGKHSPVSPSVQSTLTNGDFLAEINHKPYWNRKSAEPPSRPTMQSLQRIGSVSKMHEVDIKNLIPLTVSRFIEYHTEKTGDPELIPPQRWDFSTVAMFADVSGFTALSEHLAKAGAGGAEKLAFYLNRYLEQLAKKVRREGGDILQYAGDAIIICWPPDLNQLSDEYRQVIERKERIARAVKAARAIQNEFHMCDIIPDAITLSVKIGIGYGASSLLFVGGQFGRIEYLLCGSALKQAFDCEGCADPGDVVISTQAYKYVKDKYVSGYPVIDKKNRKGQPIAYKVKLEQKKYRNNVSAKGLESNDRYLISEYLQPFVPRAAWQRLVRRFKPWHAEQRAVTVLFINLDFNDAIETKTGSNLEAVPQDLLQQAVKTTQKCIYKYKGSLNKFLFDDKGSTVIAVFGLPPIANFDDCTRAVLAALFIEQKMKTLRIKARIGVTTGRVYVGLVGASGSASEFGILGDQVNLAARLMTHVVKKQGGEGVIVSNTTHKQAKECINIDWQRLQSTSVKGFSTEFIIWRPHWRAIRGDLSMKRNRFFIGWKETMDDIKSKLTDVKRDGIVIAIHADHWGGATHFARELLHQIQDTIYVVGTTNLAFNDCTLFAWKALLARIVRECRILRSNDDQFMTSFTRFLCDTGGHSLVQYLAVLNQLLDTNFVSDEEVDDEALILRYRVEIICHLLRQVSKYSTMVILISQLQYMCLGDWSITQEIANHIYNGTLRDVSLVLAGWSMDTASLTYLVSAKEKQAADNFNRIRKLCAFEFVLAKWTKQEVRDFLKFEFDIEIASKKVLHFIMNKTSGMPGMIKCLVHDHNLLFLKHGGHLGCTQIERCRDIQSGSQYSDINLPIPYAIQSYYTKMLDSLDQFALLTIKCAAVIAVGQEFLSVSFSYDMLYSCHPLRSQTSTSTSAADSMFNGELHEALTLLEKDRFVYKFKQNKLTQEMIRLSDHEDQFHKHDNETFYVFASGFLRDVTYGNMLYKQRSAIHKRVKKMLDREPFNNDELVQNCIRRHHLLSLHDGFYSNRDEVERKREEILATNSKTSKSRLRNLRMRDQHHSIWSFPECVLVLYIQDVAGLPDSLKASSYVTIHVGDDKGKSLTQSMRCYSQYMSVVLSEHILQQIEDESVGPVLTMRLWYKQNYRVDKTIGKFTLRLRELYEKQLSEQMLWLQRKQADSMAASSNQHNPRGSKRNSLNMKHQENNSDHTDLFVGYKMTVHVKQKKINRFNLDKQLFIESFIRFCSVDDGSKMQHNLQTMLPFPSDQ
eukprot:1071208_1